MKKKSEAIMGNAARNDENSVLGSKRLGLERSLESVREAGKGGTDPEYAIQRYVDGTGEYKTHLEGIIERSLLPRKRAIEEKCEGALRAFNIWRDNYASHFEIQSHDIAVDFLKIGLSDWFVGLLYVAEAAYSFYSMMEYLADWTTGNLIQAGIVSAILLLITLGLKSIGGHLGSWFKSTIFGAFAISASGFIYFLTFTRHSTISALTSEKGLESAIDLQSVATNNLGLNVTLICVLMFGALTVAFSKRDPRQVLEAKKLLENLAPVKAYQHELSVVSKEELQLRTELGRAVELHKNAQSVAVREYYDSVARVNRGLTQNSRKDNVVVVLEPKRGEL